VNGGSSASLSVATTSAVDTACCVLPCWTLPAFATIVLKISNVLIENIRLYHTSPGAHAVGMDTGLTVQHADIPPVLN